MPSAAPINLFPACLNTSEARILFQNRHDKCIYVIFVIKELVMITLIVVLLLCCSF